MKLLKKIKHQTPTCLPCSSIRFFFSGGKLLSREFISIIYPSLQAVWHVIFRCLETCSPLMAKASNSAMQSWVHLMDGKAGSTWLPFFLRNLEHKGMFPKMVGFPPKSSILIGFSIINHPFWGTPIFGNIHILLMEKIPNNHLRCLKPPVNNGKNYQPINWCSGGGFQKTINSITSLAEDGRKEGIRDPGWVQMVRDPCTAPWFYPPWTWSGKLLVSGRVE